MWLRTWLLASLLFLGMVASLEGYWRSLGHFATVHDDPALWAEMRTRVDDDPGTVVLLGMSRMQLDFSSRVFHARFPGRRLVRLEAPLRHPTGALFSLAYDEDFRGTVIVSAAMPWLQRGSYTAFFGEFAFLEKRYGWNARINRNAGSILQSHLAILNPTLGLREVIAELYTRGRTPEPHYLLTHPDRGRAGHHALRTDLVKLTSHIAKDARKRYEEDYILPEALFDQLKRTERLAQRIVDRGGRVIFVRFPTTGRLWQIDEHYYPRADYWDPFAARTAIDTLHFRDVPALAAFTCPDGSHIDASDQDAFTEALLDALDARGWLRTD